MFGIEMALRVDTSARIVSQDVNKNEEIRENYFHGRDAVAPLKLVDTAAHDQQIVISTAEMPWPH